MAKFMLSIGNDSFTLLSSEARERGIKVQELIRAVIIPEWVRLNLAERASAVNALTPANGNGTLGNGPVSVNSAGQSLSRVKTGQNGTSRNTDRYQSLYFRNTRR